MIAQSEPKPTHLAWPGQAGWRVVLMCALSIAGTAQAETKPFDPASSYQSTTVQGFSVVIHPEVFAHKAAAAQMQQELEAQLTAIRRVMQPDRLEKLQKVKLWVEWERNPKGAAEFHHCEGWLKANGYNPAKVNAIEIGNTTNFVKWSRQNQPWMVMHELAHAYHKTVLTHGYKPLKDSYKRAMDQKLYHAVANSRGKKLKAYCTNNQMEFFAEMTEAYLGKNDFYPFTRAELKKHDPKTYAVIEKIWKSRPKSLT